MAIPLDKRPSSSFERRSSAGVVCIIYTVLTTFSYHLYFEIILLNICLFVINFFLAMFFINLILFLFLSNCQANVDYYNVGTTLFSKRDANKRCWSEMDKDLLIARRIMQDVLPQPSLVDFTDSEAIPTLLTFIRTCFTLVRHGSSGVTQQHLLMGLADAIGGYQKAVLLPVTRQVYYAGLLSYTDGQSMHDLHEDIKTFLKTTGVGWKSGGSNVIRPQLTSK